MENSTSKKSPYAGLRHSYDQSAKIYDEMRYLSREGQFFNDFEGELVRTWLQPTTGSKFLDMPAGTGRLCVTLAGSGATVVGLDISANMLKMADEKKREGGVRKMHLTHASGAEMPFRDDTFDGVISFKFFHLIPNELKPQFIREMVRVVKPGHPIVVEFNSPFYGGILAFLRYYFRKKHPGGMRMKCIFPDQIPELFRGLDITRRQGVKLPFSGLLSGILGRGLMDSVNLWFGKVPGVRYLAYAIIIEARKPLASTHP